MLLERRFRLTERRSPHAPVLGGAATFLTMSYILFVNPAILSAAGMPFHAVAVATAIAACVATSRWACSRTCRSRSRPASASTPSWRSTSSSAAGSEWPVAMAIIVIEGLIALVLVIAGLRGAIMRAVRFAEALDRRRHRPVHHARRAARGGIVVNNPATGIGLGDLTSGPAADRAGRHLHRRGADHARGQRAVILGAISATVLGLIFGVLDGPDGVVEAPGSDGFSTIGDALDPSNLADALTVALIPVIFALFMTDFFDTIGTAVAVGRGGGLRRAGPPAQLRQAAARRLRGRLVRRRDGHLERHDLRRDGAGVAEGARTGLSSLVVAVLFALAIFFVPIIALVGQDVQVARRPSSTRRSRPRS